MSNRVTAEEYRVMTGQAKPKREPRIKSVRTEVDGHVFQSKREANRWLQLRMELKAGRIANLRRQVAFPIVINRELVCQFVADFTYLRDGSEVVEDAKGHRTQLYILKRKLMHAVHGIEVVES